jgi:hypothetical protein
MKTRLFSLAALLIALFCLAAPTFAQGDRGSITGQITDAAGAVVPNVQITATELVTNTNYKAVSTSVGVYRIPYLPPGTYRVSATMKGFKSPVVDGVVVAVAAVVTADLKLEVGAVTESVTVSADATKLESSSSELGYDVSSQEYHDWPISSNDDGQRQIGNFIFSALPGTAGDTYMGSINGSPTASHDVYIEGISIGRADAGGSSSEFQPSVDAISEFRLQTGGLSASYGGGLTAVANYNVKSGTNQLHGTGYDYFMNNVLNANGFENNALGNPRASFKQNSFGTAVGGPVWIPKVYNGKNRTFWFFSYEGDRKRAGNVSGYRTVPTPAFNQGDFSALPQGIFDPASTAPQADGSYTRSAFPGNKIPASDISTVSANVVKLAPTPNPTLPGILRNLPGMTNQPVFNLDTFTGKLDQTITDRQKLSFYWSDNARIRYNGGGYSYAPVPGTASSGYALQSVYGTMIRLGYDWTISPNVLNHFGAGYNNFDNDHVSASYGQSWPTKLGLTGVQDLTFPNIKFNTGTTAQGSSTTQLGNNTYGDSPNGSIIFTNDTTWIHGAHTFRAGAEVRKYSFVEPWNWGASGTFTFRPGTTADPQNAGTTGYTYASFLLGTVGSSSLPVQAVTTTHTNTWTPAFYLTDDWKVSRRLTLNLGLRWDIVGAQTERDGISSTLDPTLANPGASSYPGALAFLKNSGRSAWQDTYYGEVGPRIGLAYQINNKLVLRAGYGLMYSPPIANTWGEATIDGYYGNNSFAQKGINQVFNWDKGYPAYPFALPNLDPALDNGSSISYSARNSARQPYAQNFTFGLQYLLKENTTIQASYVRTQGARLNAGNFAQMNQLNPKYLSLGDTLLDDISMHPEIKMPYADFSGTVAQALLPYPQFSGGGVANHYAYVGKSNYNALQVVATRRLSKGLGFLISYSYQKTLTNTDSANAYYGGYSQDVYNRGLEKSVASFDHTQNLRMTWIYELPFGKGRPFLNRGGFVNAALGGWTVTANQQYQSGNPLSIGTSIDTSGYMFNGATRGDVISGQPLKVSMTGHLDVASSTGVQYLNPNAFSEPPVTAGGVVARLGTAPRYFGNLRGYAQPSENFGIFKRFGFGEGRFVEFRADAFNVFNRSGLGDPITTVGDPQFGQITGVQQGGREVQLALRITF